MNTVVLFWVLIFGLIATTVTSLASRALHMFSHHDLDEVCRRNDQKLRYREILRQHERVALGVEMATTFFAVLTVITGLLWSERRWEFVSEDSLASMLGVAAGLSLLLMATTTWLPWTTNRLIGAHFLVFTWPLWKLMVVCVSPLVWCARLIDTLLHRIAGRNPREVDEESLEEEIRTIVTEGHREGLLEEDAREMIEGVIELGDADVSEIMTPRTDMHMMQADFTWEEAVADVIESGHTRTPVFDSNRDDVIGILYSKDLLPELTSGDTIAHKSVRDLLRKPVFVPETKAVDDLLEMLQRMHTHIAVVLDEYGGVAGLVTIEDALEEIVGEIVDEYDEEVAEEIKVLDGNTCEALGRTHVDQINEVMHLNLPDDGGFDTIAGFVFTELGQIPLPGEMIVWSDQVRIHVLEATKRRIDRVRIERLETGQLESA